MSFGNTLSNLWYNVQGRLFPYLEERVEELSSEYKKITAILELIRIEDYLPCTRFVIGRPPGDREYIARAFVVKTMLKLIHTKQLVQRLRSDVQLRVLCGWETVSRIPSESKFSRAFREFARSSLPTAVHEALISKVYENKIVGTLVKDSTPILARERQKAKKGSSKERKKLANYRYAKEKQGKLLSRRKKQLYHQTLEQMIHDLPKECDIGMKKNSLGYTTTWKGYKLHAVVDDHCIPISAILTSASINDCEVGIPLAEKAYRLVDNFYDLMDSAYDVVEIKEHSRSLGHVPIIDKHCRSQAQKTEKTHQTIAKRALNFYPAEDRRYKERLPKERFNAIFKDYYGGRNIHYKGHAKVSCHVMFGILALTASMLLSFVQ